MQNNENQPPEQNAQPNATHSEAEATHEAPQQGAAPQLELEKKLKDAEQKYIYLYADFENYKKRAVKERQDTVKFGWENVANGLLDVLDNLDRALQFAKPETDPQLMGGLKMIAQQFRATMEKQGVSEIKTEDQAFNHEFHEAVGQLPSAKPQGTIVQEQQKGYTLHGRLLRPSRVLISSGQAAN